MDAIPDSDAVVILTAGNRLARHLQDEHARAQVKRGRRAWPTPAIQALSAWLTQLWDEWSATADKAEHLLTDNQSLLLWERIVRDDGASEGLLLPAAAAREAAAAYALAATWRLPWHAAGEPIHEAATAPSLARGPRLDPIGEDGERFRRWARRFEQLCAKNAWLDRAKLMDRLREKITSGVVTIPRHVVLAGFDEFTPAQREFFDALAAVGSHIETHAPPSRAAQAVRLEAESAEDEMRSAAGFARARLMNDPAARIGIVVPDLSARRAALERLLEDALIPAAALPGDDEHARPFNFSLGPPLAGHAPVRAALQVLALGQTQESGHKLAFETVSGLLHSPFLADAESERSRRALLDARLRAARDPHVSLNWLLSRALDRDESNEPARHSCPLLAARLQAWRTLLDRLPRAQSPARWAAAFVELLRALGWPGERTRTSREHQTIEAWRELLGAFAALDTVAPKMTHDEAVRAVTRLAEDRPYQPRTPTAPVQVLGMLEASGLDFDHLWIMGMQDDVWPLPARPNPLLPLRLQRRLGLPHASPERELQFAEQLTSRLLVSGAEIVVSHARREGDRKLRPSPLIAGLPKATRAAIAPEFVPYRDTIHATTSLARFADWQAPPLRDGLVSGGTSVFARQSDCPFRAFVEVRLGASEPDSPEDGLGKIERGNLVHFALEAVWKELGTHERLLALDASRLREHANRAAEQALSRLGLFSLGERLAALERERIASLVGEWLAIEAARAPFRVVGSETTRRLDIGGVHIEARMDRVDALDDGSMAVVDYKTGEARVADWFGLRPRAPQLPLYAIYGASQVSAVAFARVKRGACGFIGLARHEGMLPQVPEWREHKLSKDRASWEELLDSWRAMLDRLAREFRDGTARVAPRDDDTCRYCAQKPLCRIHELQARVGHLVLENDGD